MSFILEALKKAEREREARAIPNRHALSSPQDPPAARRAWPWAVALALLLNAAVLAAVLLLPRLNDHDFESSAGTEVAEAPRDMELAAAAKRPPSGVEGSPDAGKHLEPPPQTPKRHAAASAATPPAVPAMPRPKPTADARSNLDGRLTFAGAPARGISRTPETGSSPPAAQGPAAAARAAARGTVRAEMPTLPRFEQMAPELRAAVPDLKLNLIAYAADASERLVYIKNRRYVEGDTVEGVFKVEAIRREGVVLSHHDERFLLLP